MNSNNHNHSGKRDQLNKSSSSNQLIHFNSRKHTGPRKRRPRKKKTCKNNSNTHDGRPTLSKNHKLSANAEPFIPSQSSKTILFQKKEDTLKNLDEENEIISQNERAYWSKWAIEQAEAERSRRLGILKQLQIEEEKERMKRRAWAIEAIEAEQQRLMRDFFLDNTTNTQWFQNTISPFSQNYEVMCPNSWFGCSFSCMLHELENHLTTCAYNQSPDELNFDEFLSFHDLNSYDVVCPNTVLGCNVICSRNELASHLLTCPKTGTSREKENEERLKWRQNVIIATEEERQRRIQEHQDDETSSLYIMMPNQLQMVFKQHIKTLQTIIHQEIVQFVLQCKKLSQYRRPFEYQCIQKITKIVQQVWQDAQVLPYGSFLTQFNAPLSDVDLVICNVQYLYPKNLFENDNKKNHFNNKVNFLAHHLNQQDWIVTVNPIQNASIPIVKVMATHANLSIKLDITFNDPLSSNKNHNGIACAIMFLKLEKIFYGLTELVLVLKHFLAKRRMNDPYLGGLSSYGLVLMILHVLLRQQRFSSMEWDCIQKNIKQWNSIETKRTEITNNLSLYESQKKLGEQKAYEILQHLHEQIHKNHPHENNNNNKENEYPFNSQASSSISSSSSNNEQPDSSCFLGKYLMDFLKYYGDTFRPKYEGISVLSGGETLNRSCKDTSCLFIEDPFNCENNVGRNCYRISAILKSFADFYDHLTNLIVRSKQTNVNQHPLDYILYQNSS